MGKEKKIRIKKDLINVFHLLVGADERKKIIRKIKKLR